MSTRKGDNKKKGQKYQNTTAFKSTLHDTSKTTKAISNLLVQGVCQRCREIIEWKKKYKKYKPLTAPKKCVKCEQKTVKRAYHSICMNCAVQLGVCEKCGSKEGEIERSKGTHAEQAAQDSRLKEEIKYLSERQRRTFFRALERGTLTESGSKTNEEDDAYNTESDKSEDECDENEVPVDEAAVT